jgi:hypothetical protein
MAMASFARDKAKRPSRPRGGGGGGRGSLLFDTRKHFPDNRAERGTSFRGGLKLGKLALISPGMGQIVVFTNAGWKGSRALGPCRSRLFAGKASTPVREREGAERNSLPLVLGLGPGGVLRFSFFPEARAFVCLDVFFLFGRWVNIP